MAKKKQNTKPCDGMRKDGTCGNGYCANHNKKCRGVTCPERFHYEGVGGEVATSQPLNTSTSQPHNYKTRVSDQYRTVCEKTGEFFREVVKFGALLNEVADFIGTGRGGSHDGGSIKGWLAENCPDVDYNTAMGYKAMAAKCVTMIGGGSQAIAALQGREIVQEPGTGETIDVDCKVLEARDKLFNEVDSRRKLEQMWFEFCGKPPKAKGGRPKAEKTEFKMKPREENAADIWAGIKADFEGPAAQNAVKYLNAEATTAVLDSLRRLVAKFEEHLAKISK